MSWKVTAKVVGLVTELLVNTRNRKIKNAVIVLTFTIAIQVFYGFGFGLSLLQF